MGKIKSKQKKAAIVMAGGMGARLWPRSTEKRPKQFTHLAGDGTMIQNTINRLLKIFDAEDIYIVTIESLRDFVIEQVPEIPAENIILEPFVRNTAPCLGLSAVMLSDKYDDDSIMAVFPSDHVIFNKGEFYESIDIAVDAAQRTEGIVTIGINPTRPEPGFGYIQFVKDETNGLGELYEKGVRLTTNFAEKPDRSTAKRFIESGDFLWNSGIFVWRFDTFWKSIERYWPEETSLFRHLQEQKGKEDFHESVQQTYRQIPSLSIDYAILEKASNVYVVKSSFRWSDVGNWDEHFRLSMKDAKNNVIVGDVISINTTNSLIHSKGKLIGVVGMKDIIVVDSDDAILICRRGHSDDTMEIVDFLRRKNINRLL